MRKVLFERINIGLAVSVIGCVLLAACGGKEKNPYLESVKIEQLTIKPTPRLDEVDLTARLAAAVLDSLRNGADFAVMAKRYSSHASATHGGMLTLVPGWMPAEFDDSLAVLPDGRLSGVIRTQTSVFIVARDSSQYLSVRSSHILIAPDTTRAWVSRDKAWKEAEDKAWELYRRIKNGESFYDLAKEFSKDPGSAQNGGDLGWTKRNTMVREFEDVAFTQEEGAVHEPVKTRFGWHVIRTVKKKDQNCYLRLIEFKVPLSQEDLARARKVAEQARRQALSGEQLEKIAAELNSTSEAEVSYSKPYEVRKRLLLPQIAEKIEKLDAGDISELISGDSNYYFIRLMEK
ncbi:peptidylprolyl isomerase [bacterium]|nr:peptidylprolyl isomerase [bacterium]